ncbi:MAG: gliding motility-associated C-terminal domain-containing protein [Chitinophagaceae bacterium]|nr:gliding motility-associated C-terminal domain-containing protein [Chitinophagaceae bacterium]
MAVAILDSYRLLLFVIILISLFQIHFPNGDGSNDIFYPRGKGLERIKTFRIFNRWGEVVFEKRDFPINDASAGWNGTYKGNKPKADVYVYQAEVFCENGEIIKLNGNIALIL